MTRFAIPAIVAVLISGTAHAQTLTNADLGKPHTARLSPAEAAAIMATHQYVAPPVCNRCDGPYITIAGPQPKNMSGPWDWPEPAPLRRLDGTLVDYSLPTVYGAQPYYVMPYSPFGLHVYGNPYPQPPTPPQHRRR